MTESDQIEPKSKITKKSSGLVNQGPKETANPLLQDLQNRTSDISESFAGDTQTGLTAVPVATTPQTLDVTTRREKVIKEGAIAPLSQTEDNTTPTQEITLAQLHTFKDIILNFFEENSKEISIKTNKEKGYTATITKETITLRFFPDEVATGAKTYYYNLSKGLLINKTDQKREPDFRVTFYKKIQEICEDVKADKAELVVK